MRTIYALNGVTLHLDRRETLAIVGESGSGKSTLGRVILRLEEPTSGSVMFDGQEVTELGNSDLRRLRKRIQVVFQDPYASLNPRLTVGASIAEGLIIHQLAEAAGVASQVSSLLDEVGLSPDDAQLYPQEFSGGQRQRIAIARALAVEPDLVICDEPVSALDVSVQDKILTLLGTLQRERGLSYLFIAHDLAVVRQVAHRVAVMYHGLIMEEGPVDAVVGEPKHPYTRALVSAAPRLDTRRVDRIVLDGEPTPAHEQHSGCPFFARCFHPLKSNICRNERPVLRPVGRSNTACHYSE
jgi:oligopeptide/dipeptide ABC transporter ATP-binding protein